MVAAAIGGGALLNFAGGLIGSNAAGNATKVQQQMLQQQLQYQQALLNNYDPQLRELQSQGIDKIDQTRGQGLNALTDYTKLAQNTLTGYGNNANDLLRYYFPEAQGRIMDANRSAMGYLDTAATGAQRNTQDAIAAIRGGVGSATDYLTGAGNRASGILNPFIQAGQGAAGTLGSELASGALGAMPSLTDFSQLPGYQFTLGQGQAAARNAASASGYGGLGAAGSGPLGKSLIQYSEGLANTANQNNRYNILSGTAGMGAGAGANLSSILANIAGNVGNIQATGGANEAGAQANLNQILSAIAGNQGSISAATGANLGNLSAQLGTALGNLQTGIGTGVSNLQSGAGTNIANYLTGNTNQYLSALTDPMKMLIGLATNTGANFNSAISNASQGIASSIQNQGNLFGSGVAGAGNALQNYALYKQFLQPDSASGYGNAAGTGGL
jgi:hypothetical protein